MVLEARLLPALLTVAIVQAASMTGVVLLRGRESLLRTFLPRMVAFAAGVLLGMAMLHLLPEALQQMGNRTLLWILLCGTFLAMFAIERVVASLTGTDAEPAAGAAEQVLHHHHTPHSSRPLSLVFGGFLHSFVDGAGVAAAFVVSPRLGIVTAVAITLHEIPHRLGDFALLLHMKMSSGQALRLTMLEGLSAFLGVAVVALLGASSGRAVQVLLPVSAASFLYIASVNLLPELQTEYRLARVLLQLVFLGGGVGLVALLGRAPGA